MSGPMGSQVNIKILADYGFPLDLSCFFIFIDGEAIGEPDYVFQFIAVENEKVNGPLHTLAKTAQPFIIGVVNHTGARVGGIFLGYVWQRMVLIKSDHRIKSFCAETHNGTILSLPPHSRQLMLNTQVTSHLTHDERLAEMRRLEKGYKLMLELWDEVSGRGGDRRSEVIQQVWSTDNILWGFARYVGEILPSWKWIKANVDSSASMSLDRQKEWVSEMWQREEIKSFAAKRPKFTEEVLARAVDSTLKKADREPVALACFHAALEFKVKIDDEISSIMDAHLKYEGKKPAPSTLVSYYKKGRPLLKRPV
jgi:hypothetical protein